MGEEWSPYSATGTVSHRMFVITKNIRDKRDLNQLSDEKTRERDRSEAEEDVSAFVFSSIMAVESGIPEAFIVLDKWLSFLYAYSHSAEKALYDKGDIKSIAAISDDNQVGLYKAFISARVGPLLDQRKYFETKSKEIKTKVSKIDKAKVLEDVEEPGKAKLLDRAKPFLEELQKCNSSIITFLETSPHKKSRGFEAAKKVFAPPPKSKYEKELEKLQRAEKKK